MNPAQLNASLEQVQTLYDDMELAILFDWLGLEMPSPLVGLDIE